MLFGNSRGKYPVKRDWEEHFIPLMEKLHLDYHGYYHERYYSKENETVDNEMYDSSFKTDRGGFENDTFVINPYYWGDDESIMEEPNFIYKPTGYHIDWYKYPFRDSYANKELSESEFKDIVEQCIKSLMKGKIND